MSKMHDFGFGPVPAHRHPHGGGWVADSARVASTAYVGEGAQVRGGVIHGGVGIHGGVIHDGVIFRGVLRGGEIWSSHYHHLTVTRAGYYVVANWLDGEWRISAGCRDRWTIGEARSHWGSPDYHTPSDGSRICALLDWLEEQPTPEGGEG